MFILRSWLIIIILLCCTVSPSIHADPAAVAKHRPTHPVQPKKTVIHHHHALTHSAKRVHHTKKRKPHHHQRHQKHSKKTHHTIKKTITHHHKTHTRKIHHRHTTTQKRIQKPIDTAYEQDNDMPKLSLPTQPKERFSRFRELAHPISLASGATERLITLVHSTMQRLKFSSYKLGGTYFNSNRGIYEVDCSDYVDNMLHKADPCAYQSMVDSTQSTKPTSNDYYVFFSELPAKTTSDNWQKVQQVQYLRPGDILVFRHKMRFGKSAAGHVMIVVNSPIPDPRVPNAFSVRVSDSAQAGHSDDTRPKHTSGIGIGTLLLKVNPETGAPNAYAWKLDAPWEYDMNFAMARPVYTASD